MFLSGEICLTCGLFWAARVSAMVSVIRQKSADGIVVADPHAGWCGDWGLETPGYPIRD